MPDNKEKILTDLIETLGNEELQKKVVLLARYKFEVLLVLLSTNKSISKELERRRRLLESAFNCNVQKLL